jgi:hypothetical protein
MSDSENEVAPEEEIESFITFENILNFAREHKFQYKGFNYLLWKNPIQFYDTLDKIVKQQPQLEFIIKELKEIMEQWMNSQEIQSLPTDCPYMNSWESFREIISNRPSFTTSYPSEHILASLEKLASKRESQKTKELSAMSKQNTGCDISERSSKKRKVKIYDNLLFIYYNYII